MTDAESGGSRFGRMWNQRRTVRVRTTFTAVVVVGATLVVAGVSMVWWLHRSLTQGLERNTSVRYESVADLLDGRATADLPVGDPEDEYVQVLDQDDRVVSSSQNVADLPPIASPEPGDPERVTLSLDREEIEEQEPFLAVAYEHGDLTVVVGRTLESVTEPLNVVVNLLLVGLPLLLIIVGLVTWRVVGRALGPVEAIRTEVEDISSEELHRRVPALDSGDEIARLASTMNQMLARLEAGQERQRRFVSDASHELRSPVASIRQHAEVAIEHPERSGADDFARVVLEEDLRLQRLVEDLLLLARIDERRVDSDAKPVDLDDIVFDEIGRARAATDKTIDSHGVSAGRLKGDRKGLSRLVANLLDNAVRHADGAVAVSLFEEGNDVVLRVDDDGSGIGRDDRERVFDRFERLQEARDRDSGGSGLGLAIVAEVAAAHNAAADVLDSPLGGARFEVRFPRSGDDLGD